VKYLRIVVVASGLALGAAGLAVTAAFASGVYLPPTHSRGGALRLCPNLTSLERFSKSAVKTARAEVMRFGRVSRSDDLAASDPAWQPEVRANWRPGHKPGHGPQFVLGPVPATPVGTDSYGMRQAGTDGGSETRTMCPRDWRPSTHATSKEVPRGAG
jgi:hypothetical protein